MFINIRSLSMTKNPILPIVSEMSNVRYFQAAISSNCITYVIVFDHFPIFCRSDLH